MTDTLLQKQVDQIVWSNKQIEKQMESLAKSVAKIADNVAEIGLIKQQQIYNETQIAENVAASNINAKNIADIKIEIAPLLIGAKDIRAIKNTIFAAALMAMAGLFYNFTIDHQADKRAEQVKNND
jgi:predicted phage tail protein